MSSASQQHAQYEVYRLLYRKLPGHRSGIVKEHLTRAQHIAKTIWQHHQRTVYNLQVKHLRWYLQKHTRQMKPATRYRYWLTIRNIVYALNKETDWLPYLNGPWVRPDGKTGKLKQGRPAKYTGL